MQTYYVDGGTECRIGGKIIGNIPAGTVIRGHDFGSQAVVYNCLLKIFKPYLIPARLVPSADVIDMKIMIGLRMF